MVVGSTSNESTFRERQRRIFRYSTLLHSHNFRSTNMDSNVRWRENLGIENLLEGENCILASDLSVGVSTARPARAG